MGPKPKILANGICATSPQLPCCNQTINAYNLINGPHMVADVSYPDCRPDGYYEPKQCHWAACYCVDANGKSREGITLPGDFGNRNIKCPDAGTNTGNVPSGSVAASGEACLSACNAAHSPWKVIAAEVKDPKKQLALQCVDKCADVTCERKCEVVFPNRGEEVTIMNCKIERCKLEIRTTRKPNDRYGVKGGLRRFVTKKTKLWSQVIVTFLTHSNCIIV